jgi:hypothetical protein
MPNEMQRPGLARTLSVEETPDQEQDSSASTQTGEKWGQIAFFDFRDNLVLLPALHGYTNPNANANPNSNSSHAIIVPNNRRC